LELTSPYDYKSIFGHKDVPKLLKP